MFNKIKSLITVTAMALVVGCATIIGGGSTQVVNFDSNPKGAEIWIGQNKNGKVVDLVNTGEVTPHSMEIPRKNAVIVFKKEGYEDTNVVLTQSVNGWFFGNIIIGGLLGSSIDSSTGANMKYDPGHFFVELQKK